MFDTADDIAFWIVALTGSVLAMALLLVVAQWLLRKGYGQD